MLMATHSFSQAPGLKVKVTKVEAPSKSGDKTEMINLKVDVENTGSTEFKDLLLHWYMVVDQTPEKPGNPKKTCVTGNKIISLKPKDTTSLQGTQVWVSKSGVGFFWNPAKREGWNPRYHGYGIRVLSGGKLVYADYFPKLTEKPILEFEAEQAANPKK